jgi:hypothetical protein
VSWTGGSYGAAELVIEPGDITVAPIATEGTHSLSAGDYTYEFDNGYDSQIIGGAFTIVECPPPN